MTSPSTPPQKKRSWLKITGITAAVLLAIFVVLAVIGNLLPDKTSDDTANPAAADTTSDQTTNIAPTSAAATTTTTAPPSTAESAAPTSEVAGQCTASAIEDQALNDSVAAAQLPNGTVIVSGVNQYNVDNRNLRDIIVRICKPGLTGDALKDVASELARSIKASGLLVQTMRVTNTAEESSTQAKVRCEDFPSRTFSATANTGAVRTSWKYPSEK